MTQSGASDEPQDPMELATQWGKVPLEHFKAALQATEAQRKREHAAELERLRIQEQHQRAQREADVEQARRTDRLLMVGMIAGFVLCAGMLTGALVVGRYQPWLAGVLAGPSLVSVGALFVLRRVTSPAVDAARGVSEQLRRGQGTPLAEQE